jgi:MFS transporter, ACS family, solute carrier family 17 (sodium-dependent inorganic phosphate cotransporter), other
MHIWCYSEKNMEPRVGGRAGQIADKLIENDVPVRRVRLLAQSTAFLAPATCLIAACSFQGSYASIVCIAAALGLNSFALAGLYCTHQDMSQKFAGPLLGLTNTSGAVPGILGVAFVGLLLDWTDSWQIALFAPIITFFVLGTAVYSMYASSESQDYSDNTPFEFEEKLWKGVKLDRE